MESNDITSLSDKDWLTDSIKRLSGAASSDIEEKIEVVRSVLLAHFLRENKVLSAELAHYS